MPSRGEKEEGDTEQTKRNWKVTIEAWSTVVVIDANSEQEAIDFALNEISSGDFETGDITVEELKTNELESAKRHANAVCEEL